MSFKILVVEDVVDTREALRQYFTNTGFAVVTAGNGEEGLSAAKAEPPDVILTDIMMPVMSGVEMIKKLNADPLTADIPVLVFTAYGSSTTREALRAGADRAFYKPFDFGKLTTIIREMLEHPGK